MSNFKDYYFSNVGKRIRYYREKLGYTQEYLSGLVGKNEKYIGHIERYERNISNRVLIQLFEIFKVQPEEFFKFDDCYKF